MPIYEYRCSECQQVFEEWVKHAEDESVRHACPVCKSPSKRIMSHTSFALKGTGWYATDYGSHKNGGSDAANHKTDGSGTADSKSSGADATPSESGKPSCTDKGCAAQPAP